MTSNNRQRFQELPKADVHNHLHLGGSRQKFSRCYPNTNITFPKTYNGLPGMIDFIHNHLNKVMLTKTDVINFMEIAIESAIDEASRCFDIWQTDGLKKAQQRLHAFKGM